jgi:hypothetical protein
MSSEKALGRIERAIEQLARGQDEIRARLEGLEARAGNTDGELSRARLLRFLDRFRAAEALGEASVGAWLAVSTTECLRGGLRTVQQREGMHARLLAERIKELGGECRYQIDAATVERAMKRSGDAAVSDARKLVDAVERSGEPEAALKPILDMANRLDRDPETQSLLRTIAQDERSTLEFLREACALLNRA